MIFEKIKLIGLFASYLALKAQVQSLEGQVIGLTEERDQYAAMAQENRSYRDLIEDPEVQAAWNAALAAQQG